MSTPYLKIQNLKVNFNSYDGKKSVLDIDNLEINRGETYGIVGESGSGKTILALTILKLLDMPPGEIESGEIIFEGENILAKSDKELQRKIRGKKISMIFQDPMSTLNPVLTIGTQLNQVIYENWNLEGKKAREEAIRIIETVRLADAERVLKKYPHELSGGQRQRVIIALALVCAAEFIIADEPTRNLDVTIQASILKLIKELQKSYDVTVLYISNNPGLISATCDKTAILYKGRIIEKGTTKEVLKNPIHPYTKSLLHAIPKNKDSKINLSDIIPPNDGLSSIEKGCIYYDRCKNQNENCEQLQELQHIDGSHYVRCWKGGPLNV
jgi:oligopeptide/dipeptide ABC transporter ATP-binding protein